MTAHLNRYFNLTQPGKYLVQVQINERTRDGKGDANVISGAASFQIVERLSPDEGESTNVTLFFGPNGGSTGRDMVMDWLKEHNRATNPPAFNDN
jgi:hypothetical protein